jgi:hypothetical protein
MSFIALRFRDPQCELSGDSPARTAGVERNEEATAKTLARREKPVNRSQQRFGNVSRISAVPALPPPASKETLVSCAEEEATAA